MAEKLLLSEEYWRLIREQLRDLAAEKGQILCRGDHRETLAKVRDELNAELDEKLAPLAEESADILGGFVLRGSEFDLDVSLDSQLEAFREKVLPELIAKVFPED